jgi:aspartate 1-decarboxylase
LLLAAGRELPEAFFLLLHAMQIQVLKSKIHRAKVTEANLDYIGSVTIDEDLMDGANLIEGEQVHVFNYSNGERIITYVIKGLRGSGVICLNGPAALKFRPGDHVIIISFAQMDFEEAKKFKPSIVFPDTNTNRLKK